MSIYTGKKVVYCIEHGLAEKCIRNCDGVRWGLIEDVVDGKVNVKFGLCTLALDPSEICLVRELIKEDNPGLFGYTNRTIDTKATKEFRDVFTKRIVRTGGWE